MGDKSPSAAESTASMLQALQQYAPAAIRSIADTTPYTAQKDVDVQRVINPQLAQQQNEITAQYGPEAARIANEINNQNALAASQTEVNVAQGPGKEAVKTAVDLQQLVDPEFYQSRTAVNDALNSYLGGMDPNKLSATELENVNRGISSRETSLTPSALKTIQNAQTFGDALTKKRQDFGDALVRASSALPALKTGFTGFEVATRRPLTQSGQQPAFQVGGGATTAANAANTNFGFANSILGEIGANQRQAQGQQRDIFDLINAGGGALNWTKSIFG